MQDFSFQDFAMPTLPRKQCLKYGGITAQMGSDKLNVGSDKTHVGQ